MDAPNLDPQTVLSFSDEWSRFDQSRMSGEEGAKTFEDYFSLFPWECLRADAQGFDMGCGTGRWARFVAPRVKHLHCIDPSSAINVARRNLVEFDNITFHQASVEDCGLRPGSLDFGYSLGVLHHVPDPAAALRSCSDLLKPGSPLLLYLYYAFDNRPIWFRALWRLTDIGRRLICRLPPALKHGVTNVIAFLVYWPLARFSLMIERLGFSVSAIPLSYYRHHSFYTMRTDSRDRFGTPLERRFSREQITDLMFESGLVNIQFSEHEPYWCVVGVKV